MLASRSFSEGVAGMQIVVDSTKKGFCHSA